MLSITLKVSSFICISAYISFANAVDVTGRQEEVQQAKMVLAALEKEIGHLDATSAAVKKIQKSVQAVRTNLDSAGQKSAQNDVEAVKDLIGLGQALQEAKEAGLNVDKALSIFAGPSPKITPFTDPQQRFDGGVVCTPMPPICCTDTQCWGPP